MMSLEIDFFYFSYFTVTFMSIMQTIQWLRGHMTKTKRQIQSSLKLVDAVAEIIDARIPISSRNPDLNKLIQNKT